MATSGALSTTNKYIKYKITITENSYSVANNNSNVTVSVKVYRTNTGYTTYGTGTIYCKINGTQYSASISSSQKITNSGIVLFSKTLNISHDDDGGKKLTCSAWIKHSQFSSNEQSYSTDLTVIPRKSTLTVANGTLGTKQTLTITEKASTFKHKLTYSCGSVSGYILGGANSFSTALTVEWTPPKTLASQNTAGTSVSIKFTLYTYTSDGTLVGNNPYTKTFSIPDTAEFRPSCSISVSDAMGYADKYDGYIQGQSKLAITITPTPAYGAAIASYSATANGAKYSKASFTTGIVTKDGKQTITATVTDNRGRSGTATLDVDVLEYAKPLISLLKVKRCVSLEDGTEDMNGEFCQVTFSTDISSLVGFNTATYILEYKKSADSWDDCTTVELDYYTNSYLVTEGVYRFPAESGSSYNVRLLLKDNFTEDNPIIKIVPLSTGEVMEHWRADGKGMGFGKIGEVENGADFGWKIKPNKGFINIPLEEHTDLDDIMTPNTYVSYDSVASTYLNCPVVGGTFKLVVASGGTNKQVIQTLTYTSQTNPKIYERHYHSSGGVFSWGKWFLISGGAEWRYLTVESGFKDYSADRKLRYKTNGNIVFIEGAVTPTATVTSSTQTVVFASGLPAEIRPSRTMNFVCQGSGIYRWLLTVGVDGTLSVSRYGATDFVDIPSGSWLMFCVTYMV